MAKKILIIEDEEALQNALQELLTGEKYECAQSFDGEEGLERARRDQPDLVLLDLILPHKDGIEVLSALREDPATKHIPVIVLTNLEDSENVEKTLELGAHTYLVKAHYSLDEVLQKVRSALEQK